MDGMPVMKEISSRHNSAFKQLVDLVGHPRQRRPHGLAWCEGERLWQGLLAAPPVRPWRLVVANSAAYDRVPEALRTIVDEVWGLTPALFRELTQLETPTGWALVVPAPLVSFDPTDSTMAHGDAVILDRLQDPGNAGTILRSAAAAGIHHIWPVTGTVDLWSAKVMRSAMGAHAVLRIYEASDDVDLITRSTSSGRTLLATALSPDAVSLYSPALDLKRPVAWVLGQEGEGVASGFLQAAQSVTIPIDAGVESLNVSAAATVCFFEALRQRQRL